MSVNAGRKAARPEGIEALLAAVVMTGMAWGAIFITESDCKRIEQVSSGRTRAGHEWHRHYPGVGSCAMARVIHRRCRAMCTGVRWSGRAGAVRLRPPRVHERAPQQNRTVASTFVGVHGGLTSEVLAASIADATTLYRQRFRPGPGSVLVDMHVEQLPVSAPVPFSEKNGRSEHDREESEILRSMCDALQLAPRLPEQTLSPPERTLCG